MFEHISKPPSQSTESSFIKFEQIKIQILEICYSAAELIIKYLFLNIYHLLDCLVPSAAEDQLLTRPRHSHTPGESGAPCQHPMK